MYTGTIFNCTVKVENAWFYISLDKSFFAPAAGPVVLHNHSAYEVHIIKQGGFAFRIDGREIALHSGDCCIIGPNVYHSKGTALSADSAKYCFKFEYSCNNREASEIDECIKIIHHVCIFQDGSEEMGLVEALRSEFQNRQVGYMTSIHNLFSQLMLTILRDISGHRKSASSPQTGSTGENRDMTIDGFFAMNYMNDIHAGDLANQLNLSIRQLNRVMLKCYGATFKQKLAQIRVFAAGDLLENSSMTVLRIAETVGYSNVKYFNDTFKKITGMTPKQFSEKVRDTHQYL